MSLSRVGVNAVFLRPRMGGLETYVRSLVPELLRLRPDIRYSLFLNAEGHEYLAGEPWLDELDVVTHPLLGRKWLTALSELTVLGELARRRRLDLLHSVAMIGPLRATTAHVVLVGDVIWLHDPASTGPVTATLWKTLVPPVARRADRVLTFSEATRDDLAAELRLPREKVDVVPLGYGTEDSAQPAPEVELRRRLGLASGRVILSVSAKRSHKNLERLVQAVARVRERVPDALLVLPGNPTQHEEELKAQAEALGIAEAVRFPAYVAPADLEGLYALASVVVVPSLLEGFGLPVLEAMRRGVPVACSDASALPEVGGDAVRYFDPRDVASMAEALTDVLEHPALAEDLVAKGLVRAATFTWARTAEGTLESYERAVEGRQRR